MNNQTIIIKDKKYTVKFGVMSDLIAAKMWLLKKPSEVFNKVQKALNIKANEEPEIEQLIIISQLILSGILSADANALVDEDDVYRVVLIDAKIMVDLITLYIQSQPQVKEETEKNVNPDRRKKK